MEKQNIVKVAVCKCCKSYRMAYIDNLHQDDKIHNEVLESLKEDLSCSLTSDAEKYTEIKSNKDIVEVIMTWKEFEPNCFCICVCKPICDQIKTFEDACFVLSIPVTVPDFAGLPEVLKNRMIANYKLMIITAALNGTYTPKEHGKTLESRFDSHLYFPNDFYNSEKPFPFPHGWGCDEGETNPGLYLSFKDDGIAMYAGVQFRELYLQYYDYPDYYLNRDID